MGMETMSPAAQPVYSVGGGDSDNGGAWMWVMMLFFLLAWGGGGGGFGFGNQGAAEGALTRADLCNEFNFNNLNRSVLGIQDGLCDGFYAMNNGILNGFSGQTAQMQQGFFGTERAIAENRFAQQNCCCETNRNIDAVRYENSQQTCEIANAIHAEGEATRALINANVMQDLRDRLQDETGKQPVCAECIPDQSAAARCQTGIHHLQPIRCERRMLWQLLVYGYTPKERCHAALFS